MLNVAGVGEVPFTMIASLAYPMPTVMWRDVRCQIADALRLSGLHETAWFVGRIRLHAASGKTTGTLSKFELTGRTMSYEIAATGLNAVNEQLDGSVTTSPTPERWAISR